jgi:hypothetical protein
MVASEKLERSRAALTMIQPEPKARTNGRTGLSYATTPPPDASADAST